MLTLVASYVLAAPAMAQSFSLSPTDDAWVYPHASEGAVDPFLRVWGSAGRAVAPSAGDVENYSYSYLKFAVDKLPADKELESATLVLTPSGKPEMPENRKDFPLEVRPLVGDFKESDWAYDKINSIFPNATEIFGKGVIESKGEGDQKTYEIRIDLTGEKSKFKDALKALVTSKSPLNLALASKVDPAEQGRAGVYKVYSNNNKDENLKPTLILRYN